MNDDFDPRQAATMLVQQHGDDAAHYADQWATALLEAGNQRDARRFARIVRAIHNITRSRGKARVSRRSASARRSRR